MAQDNSDRGGYSGLRTRGCGMQAELEGARGQVPHRRRVRHHSRPARKGRRGPRLQDLRPRRGPARDHDVELVSVATRSCDHFKARHAWPSRPTRSCSRKSP